MTSPPIPANEAARLRALHEYEILDSGPESDFDAITRLAARLCRAPVSVVGFIDATRHWFKAAVGVGEATENLRENSFCGHAIVEPTEMLVVPDARIDPRFAANPLVAGAPYIRFYAGAPVVSHEGLAVGTLCILDVVPHELEDDQRETLAQLARQVQILLEHRRTISRLRLFESAIAHTDDAILIEQAPSADGARRARPVYANESFGRVTGYQLADLDRAAHRILGGVTTHADDERALEGALERGAATSFEGTNYRKDGRAFFAEASLSPVLDEAGRATHWVSIVRDVTERKRLEAKLVRAQILGESNEALTAEIAQRRRAEERLTFAALHDELTGLANRACFKASLAERVARTRESGRREAAVLFIDLDRFKRVNDSHGHLVGDRVLCLVAQRLRHSLRPSDLLARFGGDEFTVLLEAVDDIACATQVAERLAQSLQAPFTASGRETFIRASIGIAMIEPEYATAEDVLRDADIAMYSAKDGGRDRYQVFHATLRERALRVADLETDLRLALDRREFALVYQPVVSLADGVVHGFEALLRWQHPARGLVAPGEFISVLEETGLIVPIGERIVTEACRQLRVWQNEFRARVRLTMSINVSAKQLPGDAFGAHVQRTLAENRLDAADVNVELTESAVMEDPVDSLRSLAQLRRIGVKLHMDDFGTGYSSLSYLRQLRVDSVKIDRSFVSADHSATLADREIVDTIVSLGRKLGIDIIAEGVETEEQRCELEAMRCRYAQGYLFSRPLDAAHARAFLTNPARRSACV